MRAVSARVRGQLKRFAEITPQKINDAQGYIGYMLRFFPATCELSAQIAAALNAEGIGAGTRGVDNFEGGRHEHRVAQLGELPTLALQPGSRSPVLKR